MRGCGAKHFSNSKFFRSLNRHERNQSIQTKATDDDGKSRKYFIQLRQLVFLLIKICNGIVEEMILIHIIRKRLVPDFFYVRKDSCFSGWINLYIDGLIHLFPCG